MSRGIDDPAFKSAVQELIAMGELAIIRLLQIMDGSVNLPSKNPLGFKAVLSGVGRWFRDNAASTQARFSGCGRLRMTTQRSG